MDAHPAGLRARQRTDARDSHWSNCWWYIFLTDFGNYRDIWVCPMATTPSEDGHSGSTFRAWRGERGAERMPEGGWGEVEREFLGSYGVNGWVGLSQRPDPDRPNAACWTTPYVKGAANVPLVFDCRCSIYYGTMDDPPPHPDADPRAYYSGNVCMDRHMGGINSVFIGLVGAQGPPQATLEPPVAPDL